MPFLHGSPHPFHPTLLISPRSFVVLVLAISTDLPEASSRGFVTVQVPLDSQSDASIPPALRQKITGLAPRNAAFASHASVEQVAVQPDGIEWRMAMISDTGGAIPQWVQRSWTMSGVPKAIVSGVKLFLRWTAARRGNTAQDLIASRIFKLGTTLGTMVHLLGSTN